ncbi:hypothetical protein ACLESO_18165 [Pyxidicoccus sp. 3LG]
MADKSNNNPPATSATPAGLTAATPAPSIAPPKPVELRSVEVRRVRGDAELARMAGESLLANNAEPVAIEVRTAEPLGNLERTASPEIYVNGVRLGDTWALGQDRLVVIVPEGDLKKLQDVNEITVAWLGAESLTRSRKSLRLDKSMLP